MSEEKPSIRFQRPNYLVTDMDQALNFYVGILGLELAFEKGLILLGCGKSSIRFCPPLVINQSEIDVALELLSECLNELS